MSVLHCLPCLKYDYHDYHRRQHHAKDDDHNQHWSRDDGCCCNSYVPVPCTIAPITRKLQLRYDGDAHDHLHELVLFSSAILFCEGRDLSR